MPKFTCTACPRSYSQLKNLRVHARQEHPTELNDIAPLPTRKFTCNFCDKSYNSKQFLSLHERNVHDAFYLNGRKSYNCPLCQFVHGFKRNVVEHFREDHDITLSTQTYKFDSLELFNAWKEKIERETVAKFVQKSGRQLKRAKQFVYYECHRSGTFVPKGNGRRRLKTQGSKKIGGLCPAGMSVMLGPIIKVKFTGTHLGHGEDVSHLNLTVSEREMLAEKIASDVPLDCILDDFRSTVSDRFTKLETLTKNDLNNIRYKFNLTEKGRMTSESDYECTDEAVLDLERKESCVLLYKPHGSLIKQIPCLRIDDFVLVIMGAEQKQKLESHSTLCLDRTHTLKQLKLEVVTLLTVESSKAFPAAFLLTNRCDEQILQLYLTVIREHFGLLSPHALMSDVTGFFHTAFDKVMGSPVVRVNSAWLVDYDWQKNLRLINSKQKRADVHQSLRKLLLQTHVGTFDTLLKETAGKILLDPDTMDFANYFITSYTKTPQFWASCYINRSGVETHFHLANVHKKIRGFCFQEKDKLESLLNKLMEFVKAGPQEDNDQEWLGFRFEITDGNKPDDSSNNSEFNNVIWVLPPNVNIWN